jgi:DNA-binding FrmR family transcriptional regulator
MPVKIPVFHSAKIIAYLPALCTADAMRCIPFSFFRQISIMKAMGNNHTHTHDPAEVRKIANKLSRSIGHLNKVKTMVENNDDCSDVLIQLAAVKGELNKIGKDIIKQHLEHCMIHAIEDGDLDAVDHMNDAIEKFVK